MRTLAGAWLLVSLAGAQPPADPGMMRGVLLERDPNAAGEFSIRLADNYVLRYRYDGRTAVERDRQTLDVPHLKPGEQVEVTSDPPGDQPLRYARRVLVMVSVPAPVVRRPPPRSTIPRYDAQAERLLPKGDLSFSGVIVRLEDSRLVLRTRTGEQVILLRQDTRYLDNGELVAAADLKPNMRVFVRGGKNLYGDVEGFQVAWGSILQVH
ncbi:MAG TPA: hypothetical protein VGS58_19325 [Candidatus Sulfopaludibacter sp.]|nr:hypothetical protein [Candidatus Sulfopaludibacter sp.]